MYDSDDADSANGLHTIEMEIETTLLFDHKSQTTNHRPQATYNTIHDTKNGLPNLDFISFLALAFFASTRLTL
jgi:hypothetical protein